MSAVANERIPDAGPQHASPARKAPVWLLVFGVAQVIAGLVALSFAVSTTIVSILLLGILLLIAGGAQVAAAVSTRNWSCFFLFLLLGLLYAVIGLLMLRHPVAAAGGLTIMLAAAFLVGGGYRVVYAATERFPGWGWVLANGALTVALGLMIWQNWPWSGLWVLGTFVGIDLIFNGVTWIALAAAVRGAGTTATSQTA